LSNRVNDENSNDHCDRGWHGIAKPMTDDAASSSAPAFLTKLVQQAEHLRASDIHVQMLGKAAQVSLRLDGMMSPPTNVPEPLAERLVGRIKYLGKLKTYRL
jgi:type II secretory ATPase GspE/PulE/Tfp pilus assembly ATPase PilB-like protein